MNKDNWGSLLISKPSNYQPGASYAVYNAIPEEFRRLGDSPILKMKVSMPEHHFHGDTASMTPVHFCHISVPRTKIGKYR